MLNKCVVLKILSLIKKHAAINNQSRLKFNV